MQLLPRKRPTWSTTAPRNVNIGPTPALVAACTISFTMSGASAVMRSSGRLLSRNAG